MNELRISVIIPAKNAQNTLEKCVNSILRIDNVAFELIVIDDGSTDKTEKILQRYAQRIQIITNPVSIGPSAARNRAAQKAKGEYLAFTDADCVVDNNWLKELLAGFTEVNIVSVGGRQEIPDDETVFGREVSKFMKKVGFITDYIHSANTIVPVKHNASCNVMYRKDAFLKEGGFLEGFWPGEDVELDYRLKRKGFGIFFNPKAIVYHYRPDNLKSFARMMYRYGKAQGFLVKKYGIFRKIQVPPFLSPILIIFILILLFYQSFLALIAVLFIITAICAYFKHLYLGLLSFVFWHLGFYREFILFKKSK